VLNGGHGDGFETKVVCAVIHNSTHGGWEGHGERLKAKG
jgi:hypothetical protein